MRLSRRWYGWILVVLLVAGRGAFAGGPRYVTGYPYFNNQGNAVHWNTASLLYFTDPGGLGPSVNHAAADALVQAAAGVWNIPQASITVSQGGALAEHVSGANVYLGPGGMVYPADVASSNSGAIALAVVYDTDGSVTDTLLGSGASGPASCRQNAVTETVDGFDPAGYLTHAIVVLNGRCTGPAAAQQLQMQYQLERVFGRVLGLAWSQTNDNVLTGTPVPTYNQALHWPIMHPVDIICGTYTYQCLPNPFQLRADDVAGMVGLYGVPDGTAAAGKQGSLVGAEGVTGSVTFPTGQGMAGVNVLARRETLAGSQEGWYTSSALTGTNYRRSGTSAFVPANGSLTGSEGTFDGSLMGRYTIGYVPMQTGQTAQNVQITLEPVNPLYVGALSLGAYPLGVVSPSGSSVPQTVLGATTDGDIYEDFRLASAAAGCGSGLDGTASAPAAMTPSGWWNGVICGYGHAAYTALTVRAGRTLTVEVTALDEQGYATIAKAMPVMGLFAPGDQGNALPSVAVAATAFNSEEVGTTAMHAATGQLSTLRLGVADQRGDGRPDYAYQARVFYADTVLPAQVGAAGGTVTIAGSGFRQGNVVRINGVSAAVTSASATTLVVSVPSTLAAKALAGSAVDVEVSDLSSGADSVMTGALVFGVAPARKNGMRVVSAPGGSLYVGDRAATAFAVEVVGPDGSSPVAGEPVQFSASAGAAQLAACGAASCTVVTGADGVASTPVTPESAGTVTLMAADGALQQTVSVSVLAQDGQMTVVSAPPGQLPVGVTNATRFVVQVFDANGYRAAGRLITFRVTGGMASFAGCNAAVCAVTADYSGTVGVNVTALGVGPITLVAMDGDLQQSVSVVGVSNADVMRVLSSPATMNLVSQATSAWSVQLLQGDGVTPDAFEHVIYTAPAGVILSGCAASRCDLTTDGQGVSTTRIVAAAAGTYVVQAAYGAVTVSVTVTFVTNVLELMKQSGPSGNQIVGQATSVPFTVQARYTSGVVVGGALIIVQGPKDGVVFDACGSWSCSLYADGAGVVSTGVRTLRTGPIEVDALLGSVEVTDSFTGVPPADVLTFVSTPAPGFLVGTTVNLAVQVLLPDGVTPAVGRSVTFSVTDGSFLFAGCGGVPCVAVTDASGRAFVSGMAMQAGAVIVQAAEGGGVVTATLVAAPRPDTLRLVSQPAGGGFVGMVEGTAFAVQVLAGDGSVAAGRAVTLAVTGGSAGLGACGGAGSCSVVSDAAGMVSTSVTPAGVGMVSLSASDGAAVVAVSFLVAARPDTLRLVSQPAGGGFVGMVEGTAFAVQVLAGDGSVTAGRAVTLAVTGGAAGLGACGGAGSCSVVSDAAGMVSTSVTPAGVGMVSLSASDGAAVVAVSFLVAARPDTLRLVSQPAGGGFVGMVEGTAFAVQVLAGDGSVAAGRAVTLAVTGGSAGLGACGGAGSCSVVSDAAGMVSTSVTPAGVGMVSLSASDGAAVVAVSFPVAARPDVLTVVSAPADGLVVGTSAAFVVRLLKGDGVMPDEGQSVTLAVTAGNATLGTCGGAACSLVTDAEGQVQSAVTPLGAGVIGLSASGAGSVVGSSFRAVAAADLLKLVTVPDAAVFVGAASVAQFAVRVTLADGVTPVAEQAVVFSASAQVWLSACGGVSCTVMTGADGVAATRVTGAAAGAALVTANAVGLQVQAGLVVVADQESLTAVGPVMYVAEGVRVRASLGVTAVLNGAVAAGVAVQWQSGAGVTVDGTTSLTDAAGVAQMGAWEGPLVGAGSAEACVWSGVCVRLGVVGVSADALQMAVVSGAVQTVSVGSVPAAVVVLITDGMGNPVSGAGVQVFQTVTAADVACPARGRCPAGAVLSEQETVLVSGADGTVQFVPVTVPGAAAETKALLTVGSGGVATADLMVR